MKPNFTEKFAGVLLAIGVYCLLLRALFLWWVDLDKNMNNFIDVRREHFKDDPSH